MPLTHSESETRALGEKLAARLQGGEVVCLIGPLGAGKTSFVKGLAQGLGVAKNVQSPTFTLMQVYTLGDSRLEIRDSRRSLKSKSQKLHIPYPLSHIKQFVHVDPYRLKDQEEFLGIGLQDYLGNPETVVAIEWADRLPDMLKSIKCIMVKLDHVKETTRRIAIKQLSN